MLQLILVFVVKLYIIEFKTVFSKLNLRTVLFLLHENDGLGFFKLCRSNVGAALLIRRSVCCINGHHVVPKLITLQLYS